MPDRPAAGAPSTEPASEPEPERQCWSCGGDGWYVGHEDECYETGDCNCSGVQIGCEQCGGTGRAEAGT